MTKKLFNRQSVFDHHKGARTLVLYNVQVSMWIETEE